MNINLKVLTNIIEKYCCMSYFRTNKIFKAFTFSQCIIIIVKKNQLTITAKYLSSMTNLKFIHQIQSKKNSNRQTDRQRDLLYKRSVFLFRVRNPKTNYFANKHRRWKKMQILNFWQTCNC